MAGTRPIDARGWLFEVEDATAQTPKWLPIAGLTQWSHSPGENEETVDTTAFDSAGYHEQDVMQRGASLELEGQYRIDKVTKAQDPGQLYIDKVWTFRFGYESRGRVRWRHETQSQWAIWEATVTPGEQSGGSNDKTSWSAAFTRCGAPTFAAVAP
ncbi:phage tail tube protein [Streptomyces goshikiensis]